MQIKDITSRFGSGRLGEVVRFGLVGVAATLLQYAVYLLLNGWMLPEMANAIGYAVSFVFNYVATTHFTFRVASTVRRGAGFALAHAVNFLLQTGLLSLSLHAFDIGRNVALLPVLCICVPVNFLLVRFFLKR